MNRRKHPKEFEITEEFHSVEDTAVPQETSAWQYVYSKVSKGIEQLEKKAEAADAELRGVKQDQEMQKRSWLRDMITELMDPLDQGLIDVDVSDDPEVKRWFKRLNRQRRRLTEILAQNKVIPFDIVGIPNPGMVTIEDTEERDDVPEGTILQVILRGWLFEGELLRKARVIVASPPEDTQSRVAISNLEEETDD